MVDESQMSLRPLPGLATLRYPAHALAEVLQLVLGEAVTALPGSEGASLSVAAGRRTETRASTSEQITRLDEVQYRNRRGPCLTALETGEEIRSPLPDDRWPELSSAARSAGVTSVWSLPLGVVQRYRGSVNVYSARDVPPWVDVDASEGSRLVVEQVAASVVNAMEFAELVRINSELRDALESRTVIGQAQGVLMAREGISEDEAFDVLRRASQRTNRKLRAIAVDLVAGARRPAQD